MGDGDAVVLNGGSDNSVVDSTVIGGQPAGALELQGETNDVINGNTVGPRLGPGIQIDGGTGNQITNNQTESPIRVVSSGNLIEANTVSEQVPLTAGLEINGNTNQVIGNEIAGSTVVLGQLVQMPEGVRVTGIGNVVSGNTANGSSGDGIHVLAAGNTLVANVANDNGGYGIEAVLGVFDGGQNRASGNGKAVQCVNVVCSALPITKVPSVPMGLTATGGNGSVVLSWRRNPAGDGVSHYNVYRTDQWFRGPWASPTGTSFTNNSNVVNGTRYCYEISASNAVGEGAKSVAVCATPTGPTAPVPAVPTGLSASPGDGSVTLSWRSNPAGDGVTHYSVYRTDQTFQGPWATPTGTSFSNSSSVVNGRQYCYVISASNAAGESTKSAAVCAMPTGPAAPVPSVPRGLKAAAGSGTVILSWQPNSADDGVSYYTVYRSGPGFSGAVSTVTGSAYVDVLVVNGSPYCYQVSATNQAGESTETDPVCVVPKALVVKPPPPPPRITARPAGRSTQTAASFTFSDSQAGVRFSCELDGGAFTACTSPVRYTGLRIGQHSFHVRAVDAFGQRSAAAGYGWSVAARYVMTVASARQWALSAVITRLYGNRRATTLTAFGVSGCVTLSGGRLRCQVSWRKPPYTYTGRITLGNLNPTTGTFKSSLSLVRRNMRTGEKKRITLR